MPKDSRAPERLPLLAEILAPARRTRVVEVGANPINQNPYAGLRDAGLCDVWGFEPNPIAFARLKPGPHETYLPVAVGDGTEQTLHATKGTAFSSLLPPDRATTGFWGRMGQSTEVVERVPLTTARLDDLGEIPDFDLLKIDVQGGEMMVYDGAARRLDSVLMVVCEVAFLPLYEGQPLLDAQMARLRGHGLDLHKFSHLKAYSLRGGLNGHLAKRKHANQLLDGDAVFLRSLRAPEALSDEQLKHMALLAEAVAGSQDVVLRCLDHLIARGRLAEPAARAYLELLPHRVDRDAQ